MVHYSLAFSGAHSTDGGEAHSGLWPDSCMVCSTVHTIFDYRLVTIRVEVSAEEGLGPTGLIARNAREAAENDIRQTLSKAV